MGERVGQGGRREGVHKKVNLSQEQVEKLKSVETSCAGKFSPH